MPDLRVMERFPPVNLDNDIDDSRNGIQLLSQKLRIKNMSFKSGHIDNVEFTPTTLAKGFSVSLVSIDKETIGWGEEKLIELRIAMTINVDFQTEFVRTAGADNQDIAVEARLYDNTGKLIATSPNGSFAPLKFHLMNRETWNKVLEMLKRPSANSNTNMTPEQLNGLREALEEKFGSSPP